MNDDKGGETVNAESGAASALDLSRKLRAQAGELEHWLFKSALPLWWSKGADHERGGFQELLDQKGSPVEAPRRARVQARQIYVYAIAGEMGWDGPWRAAMNHGLNYFLAEYFGSDGLVRPVAMCGAATSDESPVLYDQAFGLLAFAAVQTASAGAVTTGDRARAPERDRGAFRGRRSRLSFRRSRATVPIQSAHASLRSLPRVDGLRFFSAVVGSCGATCSACHDPFRRWIDGRPAGILQWAMDPRRRRRRHDRRARPSVRMGVAVVPLGVPDGLQRGDRGRWPSIRYRRERGN